MSRLLICGVSPLPVENTNKTFGPGIRAWQFIKPLLADGHDICFISFRIPFIYPQETPPHLFTTEYGFPYHSMQQDLFENPAFIRPIIKKFKPDAFITTTIFASRGALNVRQDEPIWIDLFGHVMAEAQAKAYRYESDTYLQHFWSYERDAISNGDIFSAVSTPQLFATVGELGALRRLNRFTTGYEFVKVIPCAAEGELYEHDKTVIRGSIVAQDDFVILWSGGYNTWTDVETLFAGLERAMKANNHIQFVSTGGAIDGHDERTYPRFLQLIESSPHRDRFHMFGWLPKREVHNYYFEADIGINIDTFMYEGMFGSKNRVLDWLRAGLPALVGELCELSYELPQKGIGFSFPLNNADALAEKILYLATHPEDIKSAGIRGKEYALHELSFEQSTLSVRKWAEEPWHAPDFAKGTRLREPEMTSNPASEVDTKYVNKLEKELDNRTNHQKSLEQYTRHLEHEIHVRDGYTARQHLRLFLNRLFTPPPMKVVPFSSLPVTPKVSVIVVSYNGITYLDGCLSSLLNNNYPTIEIIVVDNGSVDGSASFIEKEFPQVLLIKNSRNLGFAVANNIGMRVASGDIILLLNQDTVVEQSWVREMVKALVTDPTIGIIGCKIFHEDGKTLQHAGGILHPNALTDHYGAGQIDTGQFDEAKDVDYVTGAAVGFRAELIQRIGLLDEDYTPAYFEELDFCLRARNSGYRVRYIPQARLIHYESTASGKFSDVFFYRYHRNRIRFVLKNFGARRHLPRFIKTECKWMLRYMPPEQRKPLLKAYLENLKIAPATLRARLAERKRRRNL